MLEEGAIGAADIVAEDWPGRSLALRAMQMARFSDGVPAHLCYAIEGDWSDCRVLQIGAVRTGKPRARRVTCVRESR
jgi:hypothetical protein